MPFTQLGPRSTVTVVMPRGVIGPTPPPTYNTFTEKGGKLECTQVMVPLAASESA